MLRRIASGIIVTLLLTSMLTLALNIQTVEGSGTIYIRTDGSIDPPTAPISSSCFSPFSIGSHNTRIAGASHSAIASTLLSSVEWNRTYGNTLNSVKQTSDGGYVMAGHAHVQGNGLDMWLVKVDAQGNLQWSRTYDGGEHRNDVAYSVAVKADGGYVLAGYTTKHAYSRPPYNEQRDVYIVTTNSQGYRVSAETRGGLYDDTAYCVIATSDGHEVIVGTQQTYEDYTNKMFDYFIKITGSGGHMTYDAGSMRDIAYSVEETSDGNFVVAGEAQFLGTRVVCLSKTYGILWARSYGLPYQDFAYAACIKRTSDDGFIVTGTNPGSKDVWLLKLDSSGIQLWEQTFARSSYDSGSAVFQTDSGGYFIAASTAVPGEDQDIWLIKTDDEGYIISDEVVGGAGNDYTNDLCSTYDGGAAVIGYTDTFTPAGAWLVRVRAHSTVPEIGEPRGVFVRLSQLFGISETGQTSVSEPAAKQAIDWLVGNLSDNNMNTIFVGFKDDRTSFDPNLESQGIGYEDPGYASGILMYPSLLYPDLVYGPFQELLPFDPMEYLLGKADEKQLEVHAWIPVFADYLGIVTEGLNLPIQLAGEGKTVVEFVQPESPAVQSYFFSILSEILDNYNVAGINLDYIRTDENADDVYKKIVQQIIVDFVSDIRTAFPQHILSADVYSWNIGDTKSGVAQDYVNISRHVDVIMPMTYHATTPPEVDPEPPSFVGERTTYFRSLVYSPYVVPVIQAFNYTDENGELIHGVTVDEVAQAVDSGRVNKADGFALFHYISIKDDLGPQGGLDEICQQVCQQPAIPSWKISANMATDKESYWMISPHITFSGDFEWKGSGSPLVSSAIVIQIRNPFGYWVDDLEISTQTSSEGLFTSQLTTEWMMPETWIVPKPWMARVKDSIYGAAAVTTFRITLLPSDLLFIAFSPVDIHVYDPQGKHVGVNGTGGIDVEIPGAYYSGPDSEPEWVLVPNVFGESFRSKLAGTGNGNYTFNMIYAINETTTVEESFTGLIELGVNRTFSANTSEVEASFCDWHARGDVDGDGDIDIFDIVAMAGAYGSSESDPEYDANCDLDGDGDVDIYDIVAAVGHYGESW
ncbi:hypothetical protein KAU88_09070 [Candidatus Bathyarchaeota archaeon]|nr:hypothetical protein [Candidatus Bathyarchaeota archaeon]